MQNDKMSGFPFDGAPKGESDFAKDALNNLALTLSVAVIRMGMTDEEKELYKNAVNIIRFTTMSLADKLKAPLEIVQMSIFADLRLLSKDNADKKDGEQL